MRTSTKCIIATGLLGALSVYPDIEVYKSITKANEIYSVDPRVNQYNTLKGKITKLEMELARPVRVDDLYEPNFSANKTKIEEIKSMRQSCETMDADESFNSNYKETRFDAEKGIVLFGATSLNLLTILCGMGALSKYSVRRRQ